MLVLGCLLVVVSTISFFIFTPFEEIFPWTWLNILFLLLAVLTFTFWLKTRWQPHEVSDEG